MTERFDEHADSPRIGPEYDLGADSGSYDETASDYDGVVCDNDDDDDIEDRAPEPPESSSPDEPYPELPGQDRTDYQPWQPYEGTLAERVGHKIVPSIAVPLASLAISDEVNGVPYEDLPLATASEIAELAATKEAELRAAQEVGEKPTKQPNPSSVEGMINETQGPLLEIGGPSQPLGGRTSVDFEKVGKPLIVSNVYPPFVRIGFWRSPVFGDALSTERPGTTYRFQGEESLQDPVTWQSVRRMPDAKVDGTNLPEGEGYLGSIYARALVADVEVPLISTEAPRCLEPGGILVVDVLKEETLATLRESPYFNILRVRQPRAALYNVVARRNATPYPMNPENNPDRH